MTVTLRGILCVCTWTLLPGTTLENPAHSWEDLALLGRPCSPASRVYVAFCVLCLLPAEGQASQSRDSQRHFISDLLRFVLAA